MLREVVVCSECKGEDCTVEEIMETEKVDMKEYAKRHKFPKDIFSQHYHDQSRTARRFLITCQDCGHQHEFQELVMPPPQIMFLED